MKKEKKFTLEKFEVAKLKNLKIIKGGEGDPNPSNDDGITDIIRRMSSDIC
jgi:hypothetical protein